MRQQLATLCQEMRTNGATTHQLATAIANRYRENMRTAYRLALGLTQEEVAEHYNQRWPSDNPKSGKHISYWERWDGPGSKPSAGARAPSHLDLRRLAELYGCLVDDLLSDGLAAGTRNQITSAPPDRPTVDDSHATTLDGLLGRGLAVLNQPQPDRFRLLDVDVLESGADRLLQLFLQLEVAVGGDDLYDPMTRHVERLAHAVNNSPEPAMLNSLGQLSQMAGWLALDSNKHGAAQRYFTTAIYTAHEVDDGALAASSLAYLSLQATYRNEARRAQALATTAYQFAEAKATPLVRTMLATRLARAQAKLGNRADSLAALAAAQTSFDQAGQANEPRWISYVDEIEVNAQAGACYLDLGLHGQAEAALIRSITLLKLHRPERVRDHVHYLSRLAKCRLLAGDLEHASRSGMQALDLALTMGSSRVIEHIAEFSTALQDVDAPVARDFRERFALFAESCGSLSP